MAAHPVHTSGEPGPVGYVFDAPVTVRVDAPATATRPKAGAWDSLAAGLINDGPALASALPSLVARLTRLLERHTDCPRRYWSWSVVEHDPLISAVLDTAPPAGTLDLLITTRRGEPVTRDKVNRIVTAAINAVRHRWHRNPSDRMVRVRLTTELDERDLQRWRVEWDVTGLDTISASATVEELRNHFRWHLERMVEVQGPRARP